jgi:hypothetical protein
VLADLLTHAARFAAAALETLPAPLVARLGIVPMFVGIATAPARARLMLQEPTGSVICPYQTDVLPGELGAATARACEAGVAQLNDRARSLLARLVSRGRRLAVLVALDTQTVTVMLDGGAEAPVVLATLAPGGRQVTH